MLRVCLIACMALGASAFARVEGLPSKRGRPATRDATPPAMNVNEGGAQTPQDFNLASVGQTLYETSTAAAAAAIFAVDGLRGLVSPTSSAVQAGVEAFSNARKQDKLSEAIDVTVEAAHGELPVGKPRREAIEKKKWRLLASTNVKPLLASELKAGKKPAWLKEKDLLLSGPHSPLYRPRQAGKTLATVTYGGEEEWGI